MTFVPYKIVDLLELIYTFLKLQKYKPDRFRRLFNFPVPDLSIGNDSNFSATEHEKDWSWIYLLLRHENRSYPDN